MAMMLAAGGASGKRRRRRKPVMSEITVTPMVSPTWYWERTGTGI